MPRVAYIHTDYGNTRIWISNTRTVAFRQHVFTTSDPLVIELLEKHVRYGRDFKRVEDADEVQRLKEADTVSPRYGRGPSTTMVSGPRTETITEKLKTPTKRRSRGSK
jgi:hypothetical protein